MGVGCGITSLGYYFWDKHLINSVVTVLHTPNSSLRQLRLYKFRFGRYKDLICSWNSLRFLSYNFRMENNIKIALGFNLLQQFITYLFELISLSRSVTSG